jgi:C1A family cysteine protease
MLVVGYDLKFRSSAAFKRSGVDPTLVSDHALLVRNSWGADWGLQGHLWMPLSYAVNPSTGGDAWTGRL